MPSEYRKAVWNGELTSQQILYHYLRNEMMSKTLVCVFMCLALCISSGRCLSIDVTKMSTQLTNHMNEYLGVRFIQDTYNNQLYNEIELKGEVLLQLLTNSLSSKMGIVRDQLLKWKTAIEDDYASTTSLLGENRNFVSCCTYSGPTKFNYQFEKEVDMDGICELTHLNKEATSDKFRRLNLQKTKAFTKNAYKDMGSKGLYIYYGQEDGYYLQYPGMKYDSNEDCYVYDPRTRPWYISAATQKSKDVVFLVDVSRNIDVKLSKELVETFLKTLDPRDKIAVVPFAADLFLNPEHCFNSQMVQASPGNILALKRYALSMIDKAKSGLSAHSLASYKKAFDEAFKQFTNTSKNPEKLIFLATAGIYNDQEYEVMQAIFEGNKKFSFQITISSFAINAGMNDKRRRFHEHIVEQNCNLYQVSGCAGSRKPPIGKFVHITSQSEMRNKFGSFYNFLDAAKSYDSIRYSFPYVDFFGAGILISVSMPTFKGSKLKGVASIDLVVSELLSEVTYFKEGHNAYRFLIDKSGLVYQHPLLPKPLLAFEPTVPVDISLFENGNEFKEIKASMISGGSNNKSAVTEKSISRGDSSLEGAVRVRKNYTYYWQPVPLTNFSLAVVIEALNANQYELKGGIQSQTPMIYHRLDRLPRGPQYPLCRSTEYPTLIGNSTTKLPADAFGSPSKYYAEETAEVVKQIMDYFSTDNAAFPTLLESQTVAIGLKKSINLTSSLDDIWRNHSLDYIAFRYIATEDGVFRIFPGVEVHPLYDPRRRPWYRRSLLYPDTTVISTPYLDETSQTMIITLSYLIQKKVNSTNTNVAVMGLDMSMYYFKKFLLDHVDGCRNSRTSHSCIVVDKSGLIVFHYDFTKAKENQQLHGQHITKMIPGVAKDLIKDKYLERKSCIGIYNTNKSSSTPIPHIQYFYVLSVTTTVSKAPTPTKSCPEYSLVPVKNTNVYVLVVPNLCLKEEACPCPQDGICTKPIDSYPCHCPCKHFLACDEHLQTLSTTLVCPPPPVNLLLPVATKEEKDKELKETMSLQRCNDPKCRTITTWDSCNKVGCQWCFLNSAGKLLSASDQFCSYSEECPIGKMKPVKAEEEKSKGVNVVAIVVPIVVILVVLIIILIVWFYFRKRGPKVRREQNEQINANEMVTRVPKERQHEIVI